MAKLVVGLGNPGSRYETTRHNIGWRVLNALAHDAKKSFRAAKGDFYACDVSVAGEGAVLVKPMTYMNDSGVAVAEAVEMYGIDVADELLIVLDEFQLPLGTIRLTASGGSGGHNGMSSIIGTLLTDRFARLRCGIGRDFNPGDMADYVLASFAPEEEPVVSSMVDSARDAVRTFIRDGAVRAMNVYNKL